MKPALTVMFVAVAVALAAAAPASQEDGSSDDIKIYQKPKPLGEWKVYQRPVPVDGAGSYYQGAGADADSFKFPPPAPVPADGEGTWQRPEAFKLFEKPQPFGGDFDWSALNSFDAQGAWGTGGETYGLRHKREVCMWLGQKACALKCKFFGRGATQGRCTYGYCECYYPGQYPNISG